MQSKSNPSYLGRALGAMLESRDDLLVAIASERLAGILEVNGGNLTRSAESLGISLRTLQRWVADRTKGGKREVFGVRLLDGGRPRETPKEVLP
jgi:hypothetical protein